MKLTITRPDGVVIRVDGTTRECVDLLRADGVLPCQLPHGIAVPVAPLAPGLINPGAGYPGAVPWVSPVSPNATAAAPPPPWTITCADPPVYLRADPFKEF